eukprot:COSAG02_NODE_16325_length_1092_cov_9.327291_1_plen_117_part_00
MCKLHPNSQFLRGELGRELHENWSGGGRVMTSIRPSRGAACFRSVLHVLLAFRTQLWTKVSNFKDADSSLYAGKVQSKSHAGRGVVPRGTAHAFDQGWIRLRVYHEELTEKYRSLR